MVQFDWDFTSETITNIWVESTSGEIKLKGSRQDIHQVGQDILNAMAKPPSWDEMMDEDGFALKFYVIYLFKYYYHEDSGNEAIIVETKDFEIVNEKPDFIGFSKLTQNLMKQLFDTYFEDLHQHERF